MPYSENVEKNRQFEAIFFYQHVRLALGKAMVISDVGAKSITQEPAAA